MREKREERRQLKGNPKRRYSAKIPKKKRRKAQGPGNKPESVNQAILAYKFQKAGPRRSSKD